MNYQKISQSDFVLNLFFVQRWKHMNPHRKSMDSFIYLKIIYFGIIQTFILYAGLKWYGLFNFLLFNRKKYWFGKKKTNPPTFLDFHTLNDPKLKKTTSLACVFARVSVYALWAYWKCSFQEAKNKKKLKFHIEKNSTQFFSKWLGQSVHPVVPIL